MKDLYHRIAPVQSLAPTATAATRTGTAIDLQEYESATVELSVGAWTDGTHTPKLQDSPDNSTWTDVAAGNLLGTFSAIAGTNAQNAVQLVGYIGAQRYIRPVITVSGATTGALTAVNIIKGHARFNPAGSTLAP